MAAVLDMSKIEDRRKLIKRINSSENKARKAESLKQVEIFNDRIYQAVFERIASKFSNQTASETPIVSSINLARRIVKQEASIYNETPERTFSEVSDTQEDALNKIYVDMNADWKMAKSNESFKLQAQNHVMIVPKDGKLIMRSLRNHHLDKIDDDTDPEKAAGYVISSFDKDEYLENRKADSKSTSVGNYANAESHSISGMNTEIGDQADYKTADRYLVWTEEFNFIMDKEGNIADGQDIKNPIGMLPIVDVSNEKDFEYWVRQGESLTEFTIEYNVLMSDLAHIVQNQGFAQAYLIADDSIIPNDLRVGPNKILKLPIGTDGDRPEFGYANPNSDIKGALEYANTYLLNFLTSRGLDPDTVSSSGGSMVSSSGVQEFLRMIKKFEATREDVAVYNKAEADVYDVVKAWANALNGSNLLDSKYKTGKIKDDSAVTVEFKKPQIVETRTEQLNVVQMEMELGLESKIGALMDYKSLTREEAIEKLKQVDEDNMEGMDADNEQGFTSNQDSEPRFGGDEPGSEDQG